MNPEIHHPILNHFSYDTVYSILCQLYTVHLFTLTLIISIFTRNYEFNADMLYLKKSTKFCNWNTETWSRPKMWHNLMFQTNQFENPLEYNIHYQA